MPPQQISNFWTICCVCLMTERCCCLSSACSTALAMLWKGWPSCWAFCQAAIQCPRHCALALLSGNWLSVSGQFWPRNFRSFLLASRKNGPQARLRPKKSLTLSMQEKMRRARGELLAKSSWSSLLALGQDDGWDGWVCEGLSLCELVG